MEERERGTHNKTSHHQSAEKSPEPNVTIQNKTLFNCGQKIDFFKNDFFDHAISFPNFIETSLIFHFMMWIVEDQTTAELGLTGIFGSSNKCFY